MTDARLREIERTARRTGAPADKRALLIERVRAGDDLGLRLAARCGHPLARELVNEAVLPPFRTWESSSEQVIRAGLRALERWENLGAPYMVFMVVAQALDAFGERGYSSSTWGKSQRATVRQEVKSWLKKPKPFARPIPTWSEWREERDGTMARGPYNSSLGGMLGLVSMPAEQAPEDRKDLILAVLIEMFRYTTTNAMGPKVVKKQHEAVMTALAAWGMSK